MVVKYQIEKHSLNKNSNGNILFYHSVTDFEKELILKSHLIDLHTLNSALDPDEVARFEVEQDTIILIWKIPTSFKLGALSSFNILSIGFFLKNNELVILSSEKISYLNDKTSLEIKSLLDVVFSIINSSTKHYIEHLKIIKLLSLDIQKKINKSMGNENLLQMFNLSEVLIFYLDAINSNKIVLNKFFTFIKSSNSQVNTDFVNDIVIENEQASKQAEIYSQIFAGLMDARGTIVGNNMNVLIKNLTIINIIFLPLNLIASIGGMSEFSMVTKGIPWQISYSAFIVAMILIGWTTFLIIYKFGDRRR
jgi:magnesium transporter